MELSEVGDDVRHPLREEWFRHPETLAPAPAEDIAFASADIFENFGLRMLAEATRLILQFGF